MTDTQQPDYIVLTVQLLSAYVANNMVPSSELAGLIQSTRAALVAQTSTAELEPVPEYTPAVSIRKSLASREHIISLIDGRPYKTLKRHLASHGLSPAQYRERYGLPASYPMVAPGYSAQRREVAQRLGLGQRGTAAKAAAASAANSLPATSEPTIADIPVEEAAVPAPVKGRRTKGDKKAATRPTTVATSRPRPKSKSVPASAEAATDEKISAAGVPKDAAVVPPNDISPSTAARKPKPVAEAPVAKPARKAPVKPGISVSSSDTVAPAVEPAKASKPAKTKAQPRANAKKTSGEPAPKATRPAKTAKTPRKTLGIKIADAGATPEMAES